VVGLLGNALRHDRLTGQMVIGLVGVLFVSAVVFGVGMASATYRLSDVGAWLSASRRGMAVHANGLAGKVDGKTNLIPGMRGHIDGEGGLWVPVPATGQVVPFQGGRQGQPVAVGKGATPSP
jgi:hypothetical protein